MSLVCVMIAFSFDISIHNRFTTTLMIQYKPQFNKDTRVYIPSLPHNCGKVICHHFIWHFKILFSSIRTKYPNVQKYSIESKYCRAYQLS